MWKGAARLHEGLARRKQFSQTKQAAVLLPASQGTSVQLTQIQHSVEERMPASTAPHPAQLAALRSGVSPGKNRDTARVQHPQQSGQRSSSAGCCH